MKITSHMPALLTLYSGNKILAHTINFKYDQFEKTNN